MVRKVGRNEAPFRDPPPFTGGDQSMFLTHDFPKSLKSNTVVAEPLGCSSYNKFKRQEHDFNNRGFKWD